MVKIKINDFVITIKKIEDIEEKSVGLVENVLNEQITIFFIGNKKKYKSHEKQHIIIGYKSYIFLLKFVLFLYCEIWHNSKI